MDHPMGRPDPQPLSGVNRWKDRPFLFPSRTKSDLRSRTRGTIHTNNISPATTVSLSLNQPPTAQFLSHSIKHLCRGPSAVGRFYQLRHTLTIANYSWSFGDGSSANGPSTSHSHSAARTYTVTLTVTDNEGATKTSSQAVTILSNKPSAPTNLVITATDG